MKKVGTLVLMSLMITAMGCTQKLFVTFEVVNKANRQALVGVRLTVDEKTTDTDLQGQGKLELTPGSHIVLAKKQGYEDFAQPFVVSADSASVTVSLEMSETSHVPVVTQPSTGTGWIEIFAQNNDSKGVETQFICDGTTVAVSTIAAGSRGFSGRIKISPVRQVSVGIIANGKTQVESVDLSNGQVLTKNFTILPPAPALQVTISGPSAVLEGTPAQFNINVKNAGGNVVVVNTSTSDGKSSKSLNPTFTWDKPGNYTISTTGSAGGQTDSASAAITVTQKVAAPTVESIIVTGLSCDPASISITQGDEIRLLVSISYFSNTYGFVIADATGVLDSTMWLSNETPIGPGIGTVTIPINIPSSTTASFSVNSKTMTIYGNYRFSLSGVKNGRWISLPLHVAPK